MYRQRPALRLFAKRLMLQSDLSEEEVDSLTNINGKIREVKAHTEITKINRTTNDVIIVCNGILANFSQVRNGSRQITGFYIPGDMTGLHTILNPDFAQGITAITNSVILCIAHDNLRGFLIDHPRLWEILWRDTLLNNLILADWIVNVGRRDAKTRLAHFFCEIAIRYENAGQGKKEHFSLPINQMDLADALGLTSVHVNRTLKDLREMSILTFNRGNVSILDWGRLLYIAEFNDDYLNIISHNHSEKI